MTGSDLPRYAQPRPTIGSAEITKSRRTLAHIPVVNRAIDAVAPHDPTMLELLGIDHRDTHTQYCKAIRDFLKDGTETESNYKTLRAIMGSKVLLTKYAPTLTPDYRNLKDAVRA